jgi:hypothetical protein
MSIYLQFLTDSTGSMDIWLTRLSVALFEAIHMCNFANFKQVNIISYKDHDQRCPIYDSGWCDMDDTTYVDFCKNLKDGGGGGFCECFKFAMHYACDHLPPAYNKDTDKIYVIHITDSLPHNNDINIDTMINNIDWSRIQSNLPRIDNSTYKVSKACKLDREGTKEKRLLGDKFIWSNLVERCNMNNMIVTNVNTTLDYFGCDLCCKTGGYGYYNESFSDNILIEIIERWFDSGFGSYEQIHQNFKYMIDNVNVDNDITDKIFATINDIITNNIMLITRNKIFGKLYRKLCKCRKHVMRQSTIDNMNTQALKLSVKDKVIYDKWAIESYNNIEEIHNIIREHDFDKIISYNADNTDLLNVKNAAKLITNMSINSQKNITEIMSRFTIRNGLSLNKQSIPLISSNDLFSIIFHSVAPGTLITGDFNKATLAMLARKSILSDIATKYLNDMKGKWLDFSFDKDINLYPMVFNVDYLKLLLKNKDILLKTEYEIVERLIYLALYKSLKNIYVTIKYKSKKCLDNFYPDYMIKCKQCYIDRPISLVNEKDICSYCLTDYCPKVIQDGDKTYMVQCYKCECFYSRDYSVNIVGHNSCHACTQHTEPCYQTCKKCEYKFIMNRDMPYGTCKNCITGKSKKVIFETVSDTFSKLFNNSLLLQIMKIKTNNVTSLYNMYKSHSMIDMGSIKDQYYQKHKIENMNEIIEQIQTSIKTNIIERECCAICCADNVIITSACGRKCCKQKLCNDCGIHWYGDNKKGTIVNLRHMSCMFCNREPIYKTMKKWGPEDIVKVQKLPTIDNNAYYAWCIKCNEIKIYADRDCANEAPTVNNYICIDCDTLPPDIKNCPQCEHPSILGSGCNHVTCHCGTHWCFECGKDHDDTYKSFTSITIYTHMENKHGGIYRNQAFVNGYDTDDY